MKEFNFRIDRLMSVWESQDICIKAESFEEAKVELMNPETFDNPESETEMFLDTLEVVTPGTIFNDTIEVYLEDEATGCYNYLNEVKSL